MFYFEWSEGLSFGEGIWLHGWRDAAVTAGRMPAALDFIALAR
jgi:hypothetical protein